MQRKQRPPRAGHGHRTQTVVPAPQRSTTHPGLAPLSPGSIAALQHSHGNRFVARMLSSASKVQRTRERSRVTASQTQDQRPALRGRSRNVKQDDQFGVATLGLQADVETKTRIDPSLLELGGGMLGREGGVGHVWLTLTYKDPAMVPQNLPSPSAGKLASGGTASFGFYPKGDDFMKTVFGMTIEGEVHEPDATHSPKATKTYDLFQSDVDQLLAYVNGKRNAGYNLLTYNCTHFALEGLASAGRTPPAAKGLGGLYTMPNGLYKSLKLQSERGDRKVGLDVDFNDRKIKQQFIAGLSSSLAKVPAEQVMSPLQRDQIELLFKNAPEEAETLGLIEPGVRGVNKAARAIWNWNGKTPRPEWDALLAAIAQSEHSALAKLQIRSFLRGMWEEKGKLQQAQ